MAILTYGLIGLIAAASWSICFYLYAKPRRSRRVALASAATPFVALLWLIAASLIHVEISNRLAHQDCGFGFSPDPYVTLPNGYSLGSHNTYDGYFSAPGYKTDVPTAGPGYVRSLIDLKLSDGYFSGTQFDFKTSRVRRFLYDTRTHNFEAFDPKDSAARACESTDPQCVDAWAAAETSAHNDATSYWKLYAQYRHHWPNYIFAALVIFGEAAIGLWIWKLWAQPPRPA